MERGWIGTGPPSIQPGDLVVVLNGGLVPFILRQAETDMEYNCVKYPEFTILGNS